MTDLRVRIATRLSLDPDELVPSVIIPEPDRSAAHGLALGSDQLSPDLRAELAEVDLWAPEPALALLGGERWAEDPFVLSFTARAALTTGPAGLLKDGRWVLDARGAEAALRFDLEGQTVVVAGSERQLYCWELESRACLTLAAPDLTAPAPIEVPPPDVLLGEVVVEPWLLEEASALHASASWADCVASAGLVARLASAVCDAPGELLEAAMRGDPTPATRTRAWASSLSADALDRVEAAAWHLRGVVTDQLDGLIERTSEDPSGALEDARAAMDARDRMESLLVVLEAAGRKGWAHLRDPVDELGGTLAFTFDLLDARGGLFDRHHEAVALVEPFAWWSA